MRSLSAAMERPSRYAVPTLAAVAVGVHVNVPTRVRMKRDSC